MEQYDVVIVGAGPAGGQCARELSAEGKKVLLTERSRNFSVNNFSSAGAPNELMEMFELPESIVGCSWNKIMMHSSHEKQVWESPKRRGVIMDFKKLRSFLADDTFRNGGEVKLGYAYQSHKFEDDHVITEFKNLKTSNSHFIKSKILVDATGVERQVLAKSLNFKGNSFSSTGIEYLVEVTPQIYQKWANALSVFMGHDWMPQGYSWIFPMEPNRLKVGIGRYFQNDQFIPHEKSYHFYIQRLMKKCLGSTNFPIIDKHGKTIVYTYERNDPHFHRNVIAIGDTVSTINPLAFEGIRHAMIGARIATKHILNKLDGKEKSFKPYLKEMNRHFGWKWKLCEHLMKIIYREPKDRRIDQMVHAYRDFSDNEMIELAFHYNFRIAMKFLWKYLKTCIFR